MTDFETCFTQVLADAPVFMTADAQVGFMTLIEQIENRSSALKVREVSKLLDVTPQHIYALVAQGLIPSFRVGGSIRFDPHEFAAWLKNKYPKGVRKLRTHAA